MNGGGVVAMLLQRGRDDIDFDLPVTEDDAVLHVAGLDHAAQRGALGLRVIGRNVDHVLCDRLGGVRRTGNFDLDRVALEGLRQSLNIGREGCRE